jgi:hypothetical protein
MGGPFTSLSGCTGLSDRGSAISGREFNFFQLLLPTFDFLLSVVRCLLLLEDAPFL